MTLRVGDLLVNRATGEKRFRIERLISEGRSFYIAEGADVHLDDLRVVLKAIKYADESEASAKGRREALELELEALTSPSGLLPEPIDYFDVASDVGLGSDSEPVLVLEMIHGRTLRREVERMGQPMAPARAVRIVHALATALDVLNRRGFVFRDLSPEHVLVGLDDIVHLVGTGCIARAESRPIAAKRGVSNRYSAPEIREELSGRLLTKRADVYALGALLSFLLTAEDPTTAVESPLTKQAYTKLRGLPVGYQLLVARSLQPMAKKRFKSSGHMAEWLNPARLPTRQDQGFKNAQLVEPFTGAMLDNRATRSSLSPGPLISVGRETKQPQPSEQEQGLQRRQPWWRACLPWLIAFPSALTVLVGIFIWLVSQP